MSVAYRKPVLRCTVHLGVGLNDRRGQTRPGRLWRSRMRRSLSSSFRGLSAVWLGASDNMMETIYEDENGGLGR